MNKIFVFCEMSGDRIKKSSLELLTAARKSGHPIVTGALGPGSENLKEFLQNYGVTTHYFNGSAELKHYNPELYSPMVVEMLKSSEASIVLASSSLMNRDLFARVAAKLDLACINDCTELNLQEDDLGLRRPLYSGKCSAQVRIKEDSQRIILMRPNQLPVENFSDSASVELKELAIPSVDLKTVIKEVVKGTSERLDLTEANIIVSGGRGMGGPENFKILEDLADTLGATVGASRAVVDAGWVPHNMQVGQTGKTVAPSLYIACGVSGAIQHLAGMSSSKVIVAINKDPEAPIFQKATYGIVGDVFEIVPKLTEEFKKVLS